MNVTVRHRRSPGSRGLSVDTRLVKHLARDALQLLGATADHLSILLVDDAIIARLNARFHRVAGPTDVLSFDYREGKPQALSEVEGRRAESGKGKAAGPERSRMDEGRKAAGPEPRRRAGSGKRGAADAVAAGGQTVLREEPVTGELIISTERAVAQARQFHSTPARELALYLVHGILHLHGHDDRTAARRRNMRHAERRLLAQLARHHPLTGLVCPRSGRSPTLHGAPP